MIREILYKLFNTEPLLCNGCRILQSELDRSHRENQKLLDIILGKDKVQETVNTDVKPIMPRRVSFNSLRLQLEKADREKARLINGENQARQDTIRKLEKELEIASEPEGTEEKIS